jgi:hypothetical protein
MSHTRQRLQALGIRWTELEMLWDVDEPADLARLRGDPHLGFLLKGPDLGEAPADAGARRRWIAHE